MIASSSRTKIGQTCPYLRTDWRSSSICFLEWVRALASSSLGRSMGHHSIFSISARWGRDPARIPVCFCVGTVTLATVGCVRYSQNEWGRYGGHPLSRGPPTRQRRRKDPKIEPASSSSIKRHRCDEQGAIERQHKQQPHREAERHANQQFAGLG